MFLQLEVCFIPVIWLVDVSMSNVDFCKQSTDLFTKGILGSMSYKKIIASL
jgi:hypothetical protein